MLKKYDLQTISKNDTIGHNIIYTGSKHTPEYQELKKSLKDYIQTVDISPTFSDIEKELKTKKVSDEITDFILTNFKK